MTKKFKRFDGSGTKYIKNIPMGNMNVTKKIKKEDNIYTHSDFMNCLYCSEHLDDCDCMHKEVRKLQDELSRAMSQPLKIERVVSEEEINALREDIKRVLDGNKEECINAAIESVSNRFFDKELEEAESSQKVFDLILSLEEKVEEIKANAQNRKYPHLCPSCGAKGFHSLCWVCNSAGILWG